MDEETPGRHSANSLVEMIAGARAAAASRPSVSLLGPSLPTDFDKPEGGTNEKDANQPEPPRAAASFPMSEEALRRLESGLQAQRQSQQRQARGPIEVSGACSRDELARSPNGRASIGLGSNGPESPRLPAAPELEAFYPKPSAAVASDAGDLNPDGAQPTKLERGDQSAELVEGRPWKHRGLGLALCALGMMIVVANSAHSLRNQASQPADTGPTKAQIAEPIVPPPTTARPETDRLPEASAAKLAGADKSETGAPAPAMAVRSPEAPAAIDDGGTATTGMADERSPGLAAQLKTSAAPSAPIPPATSAQPVIVTGEPGKAKSSVETAMDEAAASATPPDESRPPPHRSHGRHGAAHHTAPPALVFAPIPAHSR